MRHLLQQPGLKVGTGFLEFDTPGVGYLAQASGADFAFIDMEHSGFSIDTVKRMLRYMEAARLPAIVRPPTKAAHHIGQVLDIGADAVLAPMIETAAQAREVVSAARYAPVGNRGAALGIGHDRYRSGNMLEVFARANDRTGVLLLIESPLGVENIAEIASVEGVDGLWLGAFDLSCGLGSPGEFDENPKFAAAAASVLEQTKKWNLSSGRLAGSPAEAARLAQTGVDWICYSADVAIFRSALTGGIGEIRQLAGQKRPL